MAQRAGGSTPRGAGGATPRGAITPVPGSVVGGTFGLTPMGSPSPTPVPPQQQIAAGQQQTGMSPTAKRPLDRSAYAAMEEQAPSRTMSNDELTAGFYQLVRTEAQDQKFTMDIAGAVHNNAELLNALIGRCLLYTSPSPRDQRGSGMPACG